MPVSGAGLEVRWYVPVWYTATSFVGLKSYQVRKIHKDSHDGASVPLYFPKLIQPIMPQCSE